MSNEQVYESGQGATLIEYSLRRSLEESPFQQVRELEWLYFGDENGFKDCI